jgi:cytochrome c-type biogenesis protein CcmH/NrfG
MLGEFGANPEEMFNDMWQATQDKEEQELYGEVANQYDFAENNPYALEKQPLQTALNLSNKGRTRDAILALETHLQQHPNDVNSWRFLGRLHQENDQDRKAVTCLVVSSNSLSNFLESHAN